MNLSKTVVVVACLCLFTLAGCGGSGSSSTQSGSMPPALTLAISPATQSLAAGASATLAVTTAGGSGRVTLGLTGSSLLAQGSNPGNISWSYSPASVTAGGGSTLTLNVGANVPAGTYNLTLTASAGSTQATTPFTLTVSAPVANGGQLWSSILSSSRATDWQNAGLPATLPDGETTPNPWTPPARTMVCATIAPEGTAASPVAPTDLNAVIQTCPAGQVVQLLAGSYYFNSSIDFYCTTTVQCALHGVTLRGAGADQSKVYFSSNAAFLLGGNQAANYFPLAAAPGAGSTTVQLTSSTTGITPGTLIGITQCTTGASGTVNTGLGLSCTASNSLAIYDNGGEFDCKGDGPWCSYGFSPARSSAANAGAQSGQAQMVWVTAVSGATLTVSPAIILDDLSMANTPAVWDVDPTDSGLGLEDLSLDFTQSNAVTDLHMTGCYACWVKGIRLIAGVNSTQAFIIDNQLQYLIANNYFFSFNSGNYGILNQGNLVSNGLILNNITQHIAGIEWTGTGEVIAYNYSLPGVTENFFSHAGGSAFNLLEGNHGLFFNDDGVHGNHNTTTLFRNWFSGLEANLYNDNGYLPPVQVGTGSRFENFVANVLGVPGVQSSYQNGANSVYVLGLKAMMGGVSPLLYDPTTLATSLFWGNYDGYHNSVQWNASEVPSTLTTWNGYQQVIGTGDGTTTTFSGTLTHTPCQNGDVILGDNPDVFFAYDNGAGGWNQYGIQNGYNTPPTQPVTAGSIDCTAGAISATFAAAPSSGAQIFVNYLQPTSTPSPYRNPVPPQTLPPSFFLPITGSYPNGGTGLSWWKVCTDYPTCASFTTPPFPAIGPDVSGGPGPGGYAWPIPAAVAYDTLPVDPAYEETVTVSNATWSGGVVTLTLSSVPPLANEGEYHYLTGQFTLSGATPAGYNGTFNVASSSCTTTCTLTYALASNPGTYTGGGTFTWPLVRQFNESVYTPDN